MRVCHVLLILALCIAIGVPGQVKKNAEYYFNLGEHALEADKYTTALAHFNECLRIDAYFYDAYRSRANAKQRLGDTKGALIDYSIYLESRPHETDALLSRAVLRYELAQYLPAREDFVNLLKLPPGFTNTVFFRQDNTASGTDKVFTMQNSNHALFFNYLGLIETRLKNYKQAGVYLDSAIRLGKESYYFLNRGILKEHVMDTAGAIADYREALRIDPSYGLAIHNLAVIKRAQGQQSESEQMLNDAIRESPNLPNPYAARAYFRFKNKNLKGAIEDYDRVLQLNKADEESWLYRGMAKEKLKEYDEAFIDYTQAISLKNDFARAWLARGTLLTKLNRVPEAIEDYSVAITWSPDYGLAYYNRALAQQKLGKLKEACADLSASEKLKITTPAELKKQVCQ